MPTANRFQTLGDLAIAAASVARGGPWDNRLVAASGQNRWSGSDGGFLVQPDFAGDLIRALYAESLLAPRCSRRRASHIRGLKFAAIDQTSRAEGSRMGGARSYWLSEAASIPASRPKYREMFLEPHRLACLVYVTDELLDDVPALEDHLRNVFLTEMAFKLDGVIPFGTGAGMPLGFVNSPALITIPPESGQATGTIVRENLARMWSRLPAASRRRAVWLVNEDAEEQISMARGSERFYRPAGDNGPDPMVYGAPMLALEQSPALGQFGDVVLADLSQYLLIDGPVRYDLSIHVLFIEDETIFRIVMWTDGQPGWASQVTSANSAITRSPFVALEARI